MSLIFPVLEKNPESRKLGIRVRKIYKSLVRIVVCAKQKRPRKATLLCAAITNSDALVYLPRTATFLRHVAYHTSTGKFRRSSYKTLLQLVKLPLAEIEKYLRHINTLFPPKQDNTTSRKRVNYTFNSIDDLAQIKHLVSKPKDAEPDSVLVSGVRKVKKPKKKAEKLVSEIETKAISEDDELVIRTLGKEKTHVDVEHGECALVRRGVVMLQTHIPPQVWKRVHTQLGLDVIARQYVTAVYQPVIAAPIYADGKDLSADDTKARAQAHLSLHNRSIKDESLRLEIIGNARRTGSHSHLWFLCMPRCVVNYFGFKFGSWDFASATQARTAIELGADALA